MTRLKGFRKLTPVDDALNQYVTVLRAKALEGVLVSVEEALGRVTAEEIVAQRSLPPFDRSAVDGYAVRASDTVEATVHRPSTLTLTSGDQVVVGSAREVWTGNPLPKGVDAVIMLEHVVADGNTLRVLTPLPPGANVSKKGEDVSTGEIAIASGVRVTPYHLGLVTSLGCEKIHVVRKPIVAILSTGSELVPLGTAQESGQIIESNSVVLKGMCRELGAEPSHLGIAGDDVEEIRKKIQKGCSVADVVLTTGGTSVGADDLVTKAIVDADGGRVVVHGIAMRPGMPTALAVVKRKPVIVLSGNPVAAIVGFEVFVRPLIQRLLGVKDEGRPVVAGRVSRRVVGALGRRVYVRVQLRKEGGELYVDPIRAKGSGIITTMTRADGYLIIPHDREGVDEGEVVLVHLLKWKGAS
ncbi:MAG: molybdopterin molybdotransferase MoeA [Candidatus Bathyarchaeota archaeon]|nr:MAG: molybdopterin molybdotransferase MoeA [Candidatus Bathyarchaeota archaeon]